MHGTVVPDNDHRPTEVAKQVAEKPGNRYVVEVVLDEAAKVQPQTLAAWRDGQGPDQRNFFAILGLVKQNGRLTFGSQRATKQWREKQTAFVNESQIGT